MSLSGSSVFRHLFLLRCCGFCRLSRSSTARRGLSVAHEVYRALTLTLTVVYLLQECIYAYQERTDMDKLSRVMFLLLCHITSVAKQLVFYLDADRIDCLIATLDDPSYNEMSHQRLLVDASRWASRFVWAYSGCAVVTCTLWIVFPIIYHVQGQTVEFPFWIQIDYTKSSMFVVVLLYSYYVTTLVGIANTTMDAFMATILGQCKTQFTILRIKFETLPTRAKQALRCDSEQNYDEVLMRLFHDCLKHYQKIVDTTSSLQSIFSSAILIQFGIGAWILCMAAYKIVNLSVLSIEFASMILFISCILTELFLYCYYGNEVSTESDRLVTSIYSMEWVGARLGFQRGLLVLLERARRPVRPAAGLVIPLSLQTFLKIIKSSYTFYAVLRQTK
ncbi:candidate olfactory receptor [Bombyx mori]|uniref:Odorant receptor n=1 Tax=Bombyx mori TaxID=7091 RepID=Q0EEF5_BOMMO|nr:candidate olfactory receptor [Bombyx mori]BAF31195.1 candidate olfactory receptor [Bombyx mori]